MTTPDSQDATSSGEEQQSLERSKYNLLFIIISTIGGGLGAIALSIRPLGVYIGGFVSGSVAYTIVFFLHDADGILGG